MDQLFPEPEPLVLGKVVRRKPRVMAKCDDCGVDMCSFVCHRCGWKSGWIPWSEYEAAGMKEWEVYRRGMPCPVCNVEKP